MCHDDSVLALLLRRVRTIVVLTRFSPVVGRTASRLVILDDLVVFLLLLSVASWFFILDPL